VLFSSGPLDRCGAGLRRCAVEGPVTTSKSLLGID
jgi:hypothetical protein